MNYADWNARMQKANKSQATKEDGKRSEPVDKLAGEKQSAVKKTIKSATENKPPTAALQRRLQAGECTSSL
jgi:hypothetical protein